MTKAFRSDVNIPSGSVGPFIISSSGLSSSNGIFSASTASFANINLTNTSSTIVPLTIVGASSQSADLQQWQNSSGSVIMSISASTAGGGSLFIVRNIPNSTNIQMWQNAAGSMLAAVTAGGVVYGSGGIQAPATSYFSNSNSNAPGRLQFSVSGPIISTTTASNVTLTVTAASSQSADIQQWQNSSGSVLVSISASGNLGIGMTSSTYPLTIKNNSASTSTYVYAGGNIQSAGFIVEDTRTGGQAAALMAGTGGAVFNYSNSGFFAIYSDTKANILANPGNGTARLYVSSTGLVGINTTTIGTNNRLIINPYSTVDNLATTQINTTSSVNKGLVIQGISSQTADLQQWQNSSGTVLAYVRFDGVISTGTSGLLTPQIRSLSWNGGGRISFSDLSPILIDSNSSSISSLIVKNAASATVDLQQWRNSSDTVLSRVKSDGTMQIGTETVTSREYVQSRGMNLIANGTGALGNNYNFSSASVWYNDVPAGTKLAFYGASGTQNSITTDELIPVDPNKTYRGTVSVKQLGTASNSQFYAYAAPYDIDGANIFPYYVNIVPSTQTTLAQNLNVGDTVVYLTSTTNWTTVNGFLAVYGWKNSYGYQYPDYIYTRSTKQISSITASNNSITLSTAWSGASAAAGQAVANTQSAGTYKYFIAATAVPSSSSWSTYAGEIGGTSNGWETNKFPVGTAYIRLGWLANYTVSTASSFMAVGGISLSEVSTGNLKIFDAKLTGDYSTSWFQVKDSSRLNVPTLNVDLSNSRVGINISSPSAALHSVAYSSTEIPLIVKGATSQTANLQQWQNSNGSALTYIGSDGAFVSGATAFLPSIKDLYGTANIILTASVIKITNSTASNIPLVVQNLNASATADLQQWQNSSGSVIMSVSSSTTPLIIKNIQSSTYIQEWQNSSGTQVGYIAAGGNVAFTGPIYAPALNANSSGANAQVQTLSTGTIINTNNASNIALIVKNTNSSASVDITQWQNSSGSVIMSVNASSGVIINGSSSAAPALALKGFPSTNIQEWKNSSGTLIAYMSSAGGLVATQGTHFFGNISNSFGAGTANINLNNSGIKITTVTASNIPLIIQNTSASATGDLQQWQNSSGSVIANVNASGGANFASASVAGNPVYTQVNAPYQTIPFSVTGTPTAQLYTQRLYNDTGSVRYITGVRASIGASATASTSIDVLKSGTSIFSSSAARPVISASGYTSGIVSASISGSAVATTDYLQVQVVSVGSGASDLTIQVMWS